MEGEPIMDIIQRKKLVNEILEFLNEKRIRCTYGAVGVVIGVPAIAVNEKLLGSKRPEASWIVNSDTRRPTCYTENQYHPDLLKSNEIIDSGLELRNALDEWRSRRN